jgi:hypothetical protein
VTYRPNYFLYDYMRTSIGEQVKAPCNPTSELPVVAVVTVRTKLMIGVLPAPDHEILSGFTYRTARLGIPS